MLESLPPELLALGGALFAAVGQVASKGAVSVMSPTLFLTLRWLISLSLFSLVASLLGGWAEFKAQPELAYLVGGAIIGPVLAWNLYARAIRRLDVSVAFPLGQSSVLGTVLLAVLLLGEQPTIYSGLGALLIVSGVFLMYSRIGSARRARFSNAGLALALSAAACWAVSVFLWKVSVVYFSPLQANVVRVAVPAVVMAVALAWSQRDRSRPPLFDQLGARPLFYCLLTSLSADLASFGLQFSALRVGSVSTVVPIANSSPLFLVILSALLLRERLSRQALLGVVVVVVGIWLVAGLGRG